ncbi:MAG TPA: ATP-binding cassette domain-containing protein, partial [Spirochaetia bacterium]|nr:ATP-binding cassette domain-containing protein [Spirochaetia bacterium]
MSRSFLLFQRVSFAYDSSLTLLFQNLSLSFPSGWTGIVGANGTGKTTLLRLAAGELSPDDGSIRRPGAVVLCPQRTDFPPECLRGLLSATDPLGARLRGQLDLAPDWGDRWESLSHGERKRAQIGAALWQDAAVLCLDEPTNHVDTAARRMLGVAMSQFEGIGILVSHDRHLLDGLCRQCLFLDPPRAVLRPGTWSQGREQARQEDESAMRAAHAARAEVKRVERRLVEAREEARRSHQRLSKRNLKRHDSDARAKLTLAKLTGKDASAGGLVHRLESNLERAQGRAATSTPRPAYELGLWFSSERARRDTVLSCPADQIPLGGGASLRHPDLVLRPQDRVALVGPNGSGKSTIVRHLVERLSLPESRMPRDRLVYLAQEISLPESAEVMARLRALSDAELGRALTVVNLLGTDPKRILATGQPSPGEVRKTLIAMGIARIPHLILLDEPTNHLDLP